MNTYRMHDPDLLKSVQIMIEELESSRQSRLRAWEALLKIRATLSDLTELAIPAPSRKTFGAEGMLLNDTLRRTLQERNAASRQFV